MALMLASLLPHIFSSQMRRETQTYMVDGDLDVWGADLSWLTKMTGLDKLTVKSQIASKNGAQIIKLLEDAAKASPHNKSQIEKHFGPVLELRKMYEEDPTAFKKLIGGVLENDQFGLANIGVAGAAGGLIGALRSHFTPKLIPKERDMGFFDDVYIIGMTGHDLKRWIKLNGHLLDPKDRNLYAIIKNDMRGTTLGKLASKNSNAKKLFEAIQHQMVHNKDNVRVPASHMRSFKIMRKFGSGLLSGKGNGVLRSVGGAGIVFKSISALTSPFMLTTIGVLGATLITGQAGVALNMVGSTMGSLGVGAAGSAVTVALGLSGVVAIPVVIGAAILGSLVCGNLFQKFGESIGLDKSLLKVSNFVTNAFRKIRGKDPIKMPTSLNDVSKFWENVASNVPGASGLVYGASYDNAGHISSVMGTRGERTAIENPSIHAKRLIEAAGRDVA